MFYAKKLVTRWYETKCFVRRNLWLDNMGRNALCEGIWFDIFCIWIAIAQLVESYELKKTGYRNVIMIFRLLLIRYSYMKNARISVILLSSQIKFIIYQKIYDEYRIWVNWICKKHKKIVFLSLFVKTMPRHSRP